MHAAFGRILVVLALAVSSVFGVASTADAQGTLGVNLFENPFLCDTVVRPLGVVSGLTPGEAVEFSSPQLNGVFSRRTADAGGQVEMRWNCDRAQTWNVTVRGLGSGGSASFTLTGKAAPPPADAPIGAAFDAKTAMTAQQMAIWKDFSPFSTVGVYIDVNPDWDNRADKIQRNLTANWVNQIFADGWKLIPIYVGRQAPDQCATARFEGLSSDPGTARNQGFEAAADAVRSMTELGIGPGNPIYYDMEGYRPGCAAAVLAFLDSWTEGVHASGYLSGVYGSRSSTMWDLSQALGRAGFDAPDAVWVSTGNGRAESFGLEVPNDGQWANARMHQYRLNVTRTYGGVTREIDENIVNAPLAGPLNAAPTTPSAPSAPATTDSDGDGIAEPSPDNCDNVANPDQSDIDDDGDGDVCDRDIDGDGVDNVLDFAPTDPTVTSAPTPEPTVEPTPEAPTIVDNDGDGVGEPEPDNCDSIANPDQADLDDDGDGDVCDSDIDGDGVNNDTDQEPRDPLVGALPTATPEPDPTAAPTTEPAPEVAAEPTPTAEPEPTETAEPQVIVLPTPAVPTVTATPLPTVAVPTAEPTSAPNLEPQGSLQLADETVTIIVEDETPLLPYAIAGLALFSLFCAGMGVRSFTRNRPSGRVLS